jgi:DNA-binding CsgD family transcriptional regulator
MNVYRYRRVSRSLGGFAFETFVDRIYEAAIIPETWPGILDDIAKLADAAFASLFAFDGKVLRWTGTPEAVALIDGYKAVEATLPNARIPRLIQMKHAGFVTDLDLFTSQEIEAQPFYNRFLRPRGYGWVVGSVIEVPTGETLIISAERRFERGPVEQRYVELLDQLRPHLARSALLAARLRLERARAMTEALNLVGLPAAVLLASGALLAANEKFNCLIPSFFRDRRDRLALVDRAADTLLAKGLSGGSNQAWPVQSIPIAASADHPPMIIHLVPVSGRAHDIFPKSTSILLITPVVRRNVPAANVLQGLFDLTPAEAHVAKGIGQAQSITQIARALGQSRETIRGRLKSILGKTGLHRQVELANLLGGVPRNEDQS